MSKYFALVYLSDFTLRRLWVSNEDVITFLNNPDVATVYRCSTDQIALLSLESKELIWCDVNTADLKVG